MKIPELDTQDQGFCTKKIFNCKFLKLKSMVLYIEIFQDA